MSYRILHTADVHLDRPFSRIGSDASLPERRRRGLRDALASLEKIAHEENCDLISIGGDLYEDTYVTPDTAEFLRETFSRWAPIRIAISPGNHDSFYGSSLWAQADWPENVHIFRETVFTPFELDDGLLMWGLAHPDDGWKGDPFAGSIIPNSGTHIALFHGAETGSRPPDKAIHAPFQAQQIHDSGFLVALCGHYHSQKIDHKTGLIYPGTLEPLALDETGVRGPVVLEITGNGRWNCRRVESNRWEASQVVYDLPSGISFSMLQEGACNLIEKNLRKAPAQSLLQLVLQGSSPAIAHGGLQTRRRELLETILEKTGVAQVSLVDRTKTSPALEELATEPTVRGEFIREIQGRVEMAGDAEKELLQNALEYGIAALAGELPAL